MERTGDRFQEYQREKDEYAGYIIALTGSADDDEIDDDDEDDFLGKNVNLTEHEENGKGPIEVEQVDEVSECLHEQQTTNNAFPTIFCQRNHTSLSNSITTVTDYVVVNAQLVNDAEVAEEIEEVESLRPKDRVGAFTALIVGSILLAVAVTSLLTFLRMSSNHQQGAPTSSPAPIKAFESSEELYTAVNRWLAGENSSDSSLAEMYGYPIGQWDVSYVSDFSRLFDACVFCEEPLGNPAAAGFNDDISLWNVSNAYDMSSMFRFAEAFDGNLSLWDVSSVNNMSHMFFRAYAFSGIGLSDWDVSSVNDMNGLFMDAFSFNADISKWNVSYVTDMSWMFVDVGNLNTDLSAWDVSSVSSMDYMFYNASFLRKTNLSVWDVSSVSDMNGMFSDAIFFNSDLSLWDVSSVTDMGGMFANARSFNTDLSRWNVSRVRSMRFMFSDAISFNSDISSWDVSHLEDATFMFVDTTEFNRDLSSWKLSRVLDMSGMFYNATAFDQNLCKWGRYLQLDADTSNAFTFTPCPYWNTSNLTASPPGPFCYSCE